MAAQEVKTDKRFFVVARVSLMMLLFPVSIIALIALYVGLTFGFNLWNPSAPLATVIWLAIVAAPIWFYGLLVWSERSIARTAALFALSIAVVIVGVAVFSGS